MKTEFNVHSHSLLTVPHDKDVIESINDLKTLINRVTYIACKKHPSLERPYFFEKGVTKPVMNDLRIQIKHCYSEDFITQAIDLNLTLKQIKKFWAIINTTKEDFLPQIDYKLLLPFFIKKILMGKISNTEIVELQLNNNSLSYNCFETSQGHSWLLKSNLVNNLMYVGYDSESILHWITEFAIEENGYIIYKEFYIEDNKLASTIKGMVNDNSFLPITMADATKIEDYYSHDQKIAIRSIAGQNVSFLRGGAGTGKTSTVDAVIEKLDVDKSTVLVLAPTHKAKVRMRQTQMKHYGRVIKNGKKDLDFFGPQTIHSVGYACIRTNTFLKGFDTLIVDEIGMIGSEHSKLLNAIIEKLYITKIIFVGDPEQLSPVGLGSLIDILDHCNVPINELTTCHRSVKSIFNLCEGILTHQHISKEALYINEIPSKYIHNKNGYNQLFTPEYKKVLLEHWNIDEKDEFVAIAYTNKAVNRLNILTQIFLINDGKLKAPTDYESHKELARTLYSNGTSNSDSILVGDVVISSINTGTLVNGARGEVIDINVNQYGQKKATVQLFEKDIDGEPIIERNINIESLSLAYCCTIHKMQGDESKTVVYIWSDIDTRSLAYTACSRPRENLFIFVPASSESYIPLNSDVKRITTFSKNYSLL